MRRRRGDMGGEEKMGTKGNMMLVKGTEESREG